MPEPMKKLHTDSDKITISLRVSRKNVDKLQSFARKLENEETFSIDEVFPEFVGRDKQIALRAYRTREGLTQRELSAKAFIPQRHISEMENGKRVIGKEMAKRIAKVLNIDYRAIL